MKLFDLVTEEQWSGRVQTKKHSPEGLFAKGTATEITSWLKKEHPDKAHAMSALNFYVNRAGKNLNAERRAVLDQVKKELA